MHPSVGSVNRKLGPRPRAVGLRGRSRIAQPRAACPASPVAGDAGQPLRVGPAVTQAELRAAGQGPAEDQRRGAVQRPAEQVAGQAASNPSDHQVSSRACTSVSSAVHPGSLARPGKPATIPSSAQPEPADSPSLAYHRPAGRGVAVLAERARPEMTSFCQDWMRPQARPGTSSMPACRGTS